jgi:hypothetical protein
MSSQLAEAVYYGDNPYRIEKVRPLAQTSAPLNRTDYWEIHGPAAAQEATSAAGRLDLLR